MQESEKGRRIAMAGKPCCKPGSADGDDLVQIQAERPRDSMIDRRQTGCCEEAQADGVCCSSPRNTCECCGRSVVDFSRHVCPKEDAPDGGK